MVFASETFLFLFLPLFLAVYYLTPDRYRSYTLLTGSYLFYGWWRLDFLLMLIAVTIANWFIGHRIIDHRGEPSGRRWLALGIVGNLCLLGWFKYMGFFMDSLAGLFGTTPDQLGFHWRIILPIGVSFYVFHSISYLIDTWRDKSYGKVRLVDFAVYIALFPQLVAGPILRFKDMIGQIRHREHSSEMVADGFARFTIGLSKKVLIADQIAPLADLAFSTPDPAAPLAWLGALAYMFQLYFDFSGYSDMAVGLGKMLGFRFVENFNMPYLARSITDFWRRWHISLSVWLRDYLYISLGGNRKGEVRTYFNLFAVMALGGLWHGANWTFVIWGCWHGAWLMLERAQLFARMPVVAEHIRTLAVVLIGWVFFRAATAADAFGMLAGMVGLNGVTVPFDQMLQIRAEPIFFLGLAIALTAAEPVLRRWALAAYFPALRPDGMTSQGGAVGVGSVGAGAVGVAQVSVVTTLLPALVLCLLLVACTFRLAEAAFTPFLYFQF